MWSVVSLFTLHSSGGRESLLTREIADLESKLKTQTDELIEASQNNSKVHYTLHMRCDYYYYTALCSCLLNLRLLHVSLRNRGERESKGEFKCMCGL